MKQTISLLAAAALLTGCTDRPQPTAPDPVDHLVTIASSTLAVPSALIPVEDALTRVLPVLAEGEAKDDLEDALTDLAAALEADDGCATRTSRRAAENALRYAGKNVPEEYDADLDVIKLALESVEQTAGGRCNK